MSRQPTGSIQWQGSRVCLDLHCACGAHGHVDDEFTFRYRCLACGQVYVLEPNITMTPVEDDGSHACEDSGTKQPSQRTRPATTNE